MEYWANKYKLINMKNNFLKVNKILSYPKKNGFTLIELMVSISVFMMIMLVAVGSLFLVLDTSKQARALRYAMDNVNFAMDSISRSLRMGENYTCGDSSDLRSSVNGNLEPESCLFLGDNTGIFFIPQNGGSSDRIGYLKNGDSIERCSYTGGSLSCVNMISEDVTIQDFRFIVRGAESDNVQPAVLIIMKGVVSLQNGKQVDFGLQTLASQRNFELNE